MTTRELVEELRGLSYHVTFTKGKETIKLAADKIEQLQQYVNDMTNDHYVDTLDFYSERCQNLEGKLRDLQARTPLSKTGFCNVLSSLKRNEEFIDEINDVFGKFSRDNWICSTGLESAIIDLLETIFDDEENQLISYWVFEKHFGETYEYGDVTEKDGAMIPLKTAEDLYDCLVKNMEEKFNV